MGETKETGHAGAINADVPLTNNPKQEGVLALNHFTARRTDAS